MTIQRDKRPVFIVGCTRSGTKLISRIIGGHSDNCLLTEHREKFHIPEDTTGVCECYPWWNNFAYTDWLKSGEPLVRTPVYNEKDIETVRNIFLDIAGDKRLIVKNPQNILRIPIIKKMFPEALFIFCVRNPWHGLQSRTISGRAKYLIASEKNKALPNDLLLKSIYSWKESIDIYNQERDENWYVVKYEDTVFDTKKTVKGTFEFLGMRDDPVYFEKAVAIPRDLKHSFYPVKKAFKKSKYKKEIIDIIKDGCEQFSYDMSVESIDGDAWNYYLKEKDYIDIPKIRTWITVRIKKVVKLLIRIVWSLRERDHILKVSPLVFGAFSAGATTIIISNDALVENSVLHAEKGKKVSFTILQMQYYRAKQYTKVVIMNSTGVPCLLLDNISFSPADGYDYILTGDMKFLNTHQ